MNEEAAFLASIRAHPRDDLRRLVYADWLDERGTDEARVKAEYLRLEVLIRGLADDHPERVGSILKLRDLALTLPLGWKAVVAKVPIERCAWLRDQCPKRWDQLEVRSDDWTRLCTTCQEIVYFCPSVEDAWQEAEGLGRCVVIDPGERREAGDMDPIRPAPGPDAVPVDEITLPDDFIPAAHPPAPPPPPQPGLLLRLWRRLTGR